MNKTVFLDRDGTINKDREGYTHRIEDMEFLPNAIDGIKKLQGFNIIIVTNQGGIEKGLYTLENYFNFRGEMHKRFSNYGIKILAEYFCPHHPNKNCDCRKPKTGMLERAAREFDLNLGECWMIGDKESDVLVGKNVGCKTIHVLTGKCKFTPYADFVARDLSEAADYILNFEYNNK